MHSYITNSVLHDVLQYIRGKFKKYQLTISMIFVSKYRNIQQYFICNKYKCSQKYNDRSNTSSQNVVVHNGRQHDQKIYSFLKIFYNEI